MAPDLRLGPQTVAHSAHHARPFSIRRATRGVAYSSLHKECEPAPDRSTWLPQCRYFIVGRWRSRLLRQTHWDRKEKIRLDCRLGPRRPLRNRAGIFRNSSDSRASPARGRHCATKYGHWRFCPQYRAQTLHISSPGESIAGMAGRHNSCASGEFELVCALRERAVPHHWRIYSLGSNWVCTARIARPHSIAAG